MSIFDNIDENVKSVDDFYSYATGKWLENNPQPAEYPVWNVFTKLHDNNVNRINNIITEETDDSNILSKKINMYYNIIMNYERRNNEHIKPVLEFINNHCCYNTADEYIEDSAKNNIELFFNTGLTPDSKGSGKYEVCIYQSGLGLGNKEYYINKTEANTKIMNAYIEYINDMHLAFYGNKSENFVANLMSVEDMLARYSYLEEELQDPVLNYNRMSVSDLSEQTDFDWNSYLCNLGFDKTESVIVSNLNFLKVACHLLKTLDINIISDIYKWNIMNMSANKLSDSIYDINFKFSQIFSGATVQIPKWKRAVNNVNGIFSEAIAQIYVSKYFDESSKKDVLTLINNLKKSFSSIINEQEWMSDETKVKALDKLDSMTFKIGYPDKWDDYSDIPINNELSYFDNYMLVRKYLWNKDLNKHYNKDIDKDEWYMAAQSVNAYYDPIQNEICFPTGILQYPFYDKNRDAVENYGGIGTIIAHEMTHAFDNHGRLYDKNGILNEWWNEEDSERFKLLTENTVNHFNEIEVLPGLNCNGTLTLGENIADYGGVKISYNAYNIFVNELKDSLNENKYFNEQWLQDKFSDDTWKHKFFVAYANNWSGVTTEESIRYNIINNEHTINKYRVNGTLPMFTEWVKCYNVSDTDKLYVSEEKRAKIW